MSDVTKNTAAAYSALKQVYEDLNRLGQDFGEALRERGYEFPHSSEYSTSPASLTLKKSHAWFFALPPSEDDATLQFAACFAYFEADPKRWKLRPSGVPELWFFMGTVAPPPSDNWASRIREFFDTADIGCYAEKPTQHGKVYRYEYKKEGEHWRAVCVGFELGAIDSQETLKSLAAQPLFEAAEKDELLL